MLSLQVIPMSTFICHCRATLLRMLKSGNNCKLLTVNSNLRFFSCEARSYGQSVRRIISSEDVGCLLLGYLKVIYIYHHLILLPYVQLSCFMIVTLWVLSILMYLMCNCYGLLSMVDWSNFIWKLDSVSISTIIESCYTWPFFEYSDCSIIWKTAVGWCYWQHWCHNTRPSSNLGSERIIWGQQWPLENCLLYYILVNF